MKKKELLKRIQELEQINREKYEVIIKLMQQLSDNNKSTYKECYSSPNGRHEYPFTWTGTGGRSCIHCGQYEQNWFGNWWATNGITTANLPTITTNNDGSVNLKSGNNFNK